MCLLDIRMPGMDDIEATRQIVALTEPPAVVVITTFDLDDYVHGALRAGAKDFPLTDAGPELLTQAVHAGAGGNALIAPRITRRLLETFAGSDVSTWEQPSEPIEPLTERAEDVLLTVARGRANAAMGADGWSNLSPTKLFR